MCVCFMCVSEQLQWTPELLFPNPQVQSFRIIVSWACVFILLRNFETGRILILINAEHTGKTFIITPARTLCLFL